MRAAPTGRFPAAFLPDSLKQLGVSLRRFKTGTPARVLTSGPSTFQTWKSSTGTSRWCPSPTTRRSLPPNKEVCHVSWTNDATKQVILDNIHRSPLYGGMIEGVGPRYCPSIEDKVVRFPGQAPAPAVHRAHAGWTPRRCTSRACPPPCRRMCRSPFYHTIPGLEHVQIMRTAYAIEYDCVRPSAAVPLPWSSKTGPAFTGRGSSTAAPAMRRLPPRALWRASTPRRKVQGKEPFDPGPRQLLHRHPH